MLNKNWLTIWNFLFLEWAHLPVWTQMNVGGGRAYRDSCWGDSFGERGGQTKGLGQAERPDAFSNFAPFESSSCCFADLVDGKVAHFFLLHEDVSLQYFMPAVNVWRNSWISVLPLRCFLCSISDRKILINLLLLSKRKFWFYGIVTAPGNCKFHAGCEMGIGNVTAAFEFTRLSASSGFR